MAAKLAEPEFRPAGAVRPVQHRGAGHHRVAAGRSGRARQARRRRLGRARRPGHHHVPPGRRGRHGLGRLARAGGPARRAGRRGHRHVRRLPATALRGAGARPSSPPAPPAPTTATRPRVPSTCPRPRRPRSSTGACAGRPRAADAEAFRAHMLVEFARMSIEDGLVMQLHPGAVRNHNRWLHDAHGRDVGGDIPQADRLRARASRRCCAAYGNDPRLRLVLYTLDESTFTRELAPLAGGYPARLPRRAVVVPGHARRACAASARRSPRRPASTTPPASSTTPGRSARSRSATTWPAGSTPASWPGWSPRTGCRWTRPPRPSPTSPTTCPNGSSGWSASLMPPRSPRVDVHDVRFPTAAAGDGSDAINRGDYSADLCGAAHRRPASPGPASPSPTAAATRSPARPCGRCAHHVVGPYAWRTSSPSRWRSGARSPPTCSCAGSARRRASSTWPPARWSTPCGTCGPGSPASRCGGCSPSCRPRNWSPASTSTTSPTRSPRPRRCELLEKAGAGLRRPAGPCSRRDGFPAYTTSVGWLGYPDDKVRALTRAGRTPRAGGR